ncbi:MAG: hypothetical protein ACP5UO_05560 [Thermoplasmata archaeon]
MANVEERIRKLQNRLTELRSSGSYPSNCEAVARIDIQIAQVYASTGNTLQYQDYIQDAIRTLQEPMCPKNQRIESMIKSLEYYKDKPQLLAAGNVPGIYRYLSLIVLLVGYLIVIVLDAYLKPVFTETDFLIGIVIVFFLSIVVNFAVRGRATRRASQQQYQ